jgi:hypothetical protein
VLRSLGASPATTVVVDGLVGVVGAVVLGALVAVGVAVALSPLGPIGPIRRGRSLSRGVRRFDGTVEGLGFGGAGGSDSGWPRWRSRCAGLPGEPAAITRRPPFESWFAPPRRRDCPMAGVVGTHFALEPGQGRTAVPVRSVLVGTVLAVAMVVATLTFSSGLSTLVSHPGAVWLELELRRSIPPTTSRRGRWHCSNHDHDVAAWTGIRLLRRGPRWSDVAVSDESRRSRGSRRRFSRATG